MPFFSSNHLGNFPVKFISRRIVGHTLCARIQIKKCDRACKQGSGEVYVRIARTTGEEDNKRYPAAPTNAPGLAAAPAPAMHPDRWQRVDKCADQSDLPPAEGDSARHRRSAAPGGNAERLHEQDRRSAAPRGSSACQ